DTPLPEMWARSTERAHAAEVALRANERLLEAGGALATFPFCPALALQRTGDPFRPDDDHRERAEIAARVLSSR
ncbi:MAG TPA: hypothetical protein VGB87_21630, partial [Vicinamibacteria bacterium]